MKKLLFMLVVLLAACSKSSEDDMNNNNNNPGGGNNNPGTCITTNMKYSTDIAPIISANCFACHSNANASISGFSLEGHSNLKAKVDDGRLVGAITHAAGFTPMPDGLPKLSDCNIAKIVSWVNAGAPNN